MKLVFLTPFSYPSGYAHPIHGWEMARSLARKLGNDFLFVIYSLKEEGVPLLEGINYQIAFGPRGALLTKFHLRTLAYGIWLFSYLVHLSRKTRRTYWFYINDPILMFISVPLKWLFRFQIVFECHGFYSRFQEKIIFGFADRVVFTTDILRQAAIKKHGIKESRTLTLPNSVDVSRFELVTDSPASIRQSFDLPIDKKIIGYVGRFKPTGDDKGLLFMIDALSRLPKNIILLLVGGLSYELEEYKQYVRNQDFEDRVIFVGHISSEMVPYYEKACDMLVYVPQIRNDFFEKETSPMKLFEYMASRRPVVISDMPTTREILDDESAFFIFPGDHEQFVQAVQIILKGGAEVVEKVDRAFLLVSKNTWENRGSRLIDFIQLGITS